MVTARTAAGRPPKILTPTAHRYTFLDVPGVPTGGFLGRVTFKNTVRRLNWEGQPMPLGHDDPDHPILSDAWKYEIVRPDWHKDPDQVPEPYVDLVLRKDNEKRHLRFWRPTDLVIDNGPRMTGGLYILDVRARMMEGIGVYVGDFENSEGGVTFWAHRVEELPSV